MGNEREQKEENLSLGSTEWYRPVLNGPGNSGELNWTATAHVANNSGGHPAADFFPFGF